MSRKKNKSKIPENHRFSIENEDEVLRFLYEECANKVKSSEKDDVDYLCTSFLDDDEITDDCDEEIEEIDENGEFISKKDKDDEIDIDENYIKRYWNEETENGIIEFLYLNEFFYEARIKEEEEEAIKQDRVINKFYCNEMQRRMEELLKIPNREIQREKIFREKIEDPLKKLVENILFNYKLFVPDIDIKTQQRDCITFLYLKFPNFNPWRKTKSFSYFGTIAKHYFLGNKKDYSKSTKILNDYDSNKEEADSKKIENPKVYIEEDPSLDLFNFITESIENELKRNTFSKNDQKVGDVIVQIFKNHEIIGVYNKNQVYQLIKEGTGLETKDITYSLHRFRIAYKSMKQEFIKKRKT
ncbi:MAG: hypothetical protein WC466_06205 [Candidatus Izemoplasmatales bacterium]